MELYSVKEIADLKGINVRSVTERARVRMIEPTKKKGTSAYYFTPEQINQMFGEKLNIATEGVIYAHTEWHFFESQLNFKELHELT